LRQDTVHRDEDAVWVKESDLKQPPSVSVERQSATDGRSEFVERAQPACFTGRAMNDLPSTTAVERGRAGGRKADREGNKKGEEGKKIMCI